MLKLLFPVVILFTMWQEIKGQKIVGDSLDISLLTCSQGNELYSAFGHSAIRVQDRLNQVDAVFNYGTFDFSQEGFYINFVRGRLLYFLDIDQFESFYNQYKYEGREIRELGLRLTGVEKENILKFLLWNSKRENRFYAYDFFWDNCSTRVRDIFSKELKYKLVWNTAGWDTSITLRNCLKPYVHHLPWVDFGFDLILGLPCEKTAGVMDQTFLPDRLDRLVRNASLQTDSGKLSFIVRDTVLLPSYNIKTSSSPFLSPLSCFTILFIIVSGLTIAERKKKILFPALDYLMLGGSGFLGFFFLLMGLTEHYSTPWNLNMLWLLPTNLIVLFLPKNKIGDLLRKNYFKGAFGLNVLILICFPVFPQQLHLAFIPIILTLLLRYWKNFNKVQADV